MLGERLGVSPPCAIPSLYIKKIYDERELEELATVKDYLTVQTEGS